MKYPFHTLFITLFLSLASSCVAQQAEEKPGYRIELAVEDTNEAKLYLGFYYKGKTYVKDSAVLNIEENNYVFEGTKSLDPGSFFLLNGGNRLIYEFVVGDDQYFKLSFPSFSLPNKTVVEGDPDNELFFEVIRLNADNYEKARTYLEQLQDTTTTKEVTAKAKEALNRINEVLRKKRYEIADKYPDHIISKFINADRFYEVPEALGLSDSKEDSAERFYLLRSHYFDYVNFSDSIYLRFPSSSRSEEGPDLVERKVETYLDEFHLPAADTLIEAIERLVASCGDNKAMFEHIIWYCTGKYDDPKVMGQDKLLVYLYDTYYATGRMDGFANDALKKEIKKYADRYRLSQIGNRAPNLEMQDINLQKRSLYGMKNAYRVVYFFNPDCHGCSVETPKLAKAAKESSLDVGVFAVDTDTSMTKMKKYIKKMKLEDWIVVSGPRSYSGNYQTLYDAFSTPVLMVLDSENRIIAKKLPADKLVGFLSNHEAYLREKKKNKTQ